MPVSTSQQIARYYEQFRDVDVTFTKTVITATMLNPREVYLKCLGHQWPCIVYSSSMTGAKIVANVSSALTKTVKKANNLVSLRFSFMQKDKPDPLHFFVASKVSGYTPYSKEKPELNFISLAYTQRPPDDLIETLGQLLEANVNATRRKEQRITLTADSSKKLGIKQKGARVTVGGVPRNCIVRDISFSGAKVIVLGVGNFLVDKPATLRLQLDEPPEVVHIEGTVVRFDPVEGRDDLAALAIQFDDELVPMNYKLRVNSYLKATKNTHQ